MKQARQTHSIKDIVFILALFAAALLAVPARSADPSFNIYLQQWLTRDAHLAFDGVKLPTAPLNDFYRAHAYQPQWVSDGQLNNRARKALDLITRASEQGLNTASYHVDTIHAIERAGALHGEDALRASLSLEILTSDAVAHYAGDMASGSTEFSRQVKGLRVMRPAAEAILAQAAAAPDISGYLARLEPGIQDYLALKTLLAQYRTIAAADGWPTIGSGKTIKPGMSDARVANLTALLLTTGDLSVVEKNIDPSLYSGMLVEAVKRFQGRHGLEPDGNIGGKTLGALNTPVEERIRQISASMERMRWMPRNNATSYVLVNLPGYWLKGYAAGKEQLHMRVIVGKPSTKTPLFSNVITDVVFNPSWGVPSKIAVNELVPKGRKNPDYFIHAGYRVTRDGEEIDPRDIDWANTDGRELSFRQKPGEGNALGKIKFNIPDSDDIYLHSTSQPKLFAKAERSLSHGCIRLEDPKAMAHFVLGRESWQEADIDKTYDSVTSKTVRVKPLPVHLVYWTSFVDDKGVAHFHQDIYGINKKLIAELAPNLPAHNDVRVASLATTH